MQRRHFIKLTSAASVGLLLSRTTYAAANGTLSLAAPNEVWVQSGNNWQQLKSTNTNHFTLEDYIVDIPTKNGVLSIYATSPSKPLSGVRLRWKHDVGVKAAFLGDQFERSYGDLQWRAHPDTAKCPWYILISNGSKTAAYGLKTGANSIAWWNLSDAYLELTLDTHSGGNGVSLGKRTLHAADIIATENKDGENAYHTLHRFCGMMCDKPRLPRQPIYGLNDWNFAYGNNSFDLIKQTTAMMAELVTDTSNKPFSVIDGGWAQYSPLLPNDGGWNEDFSKPNDKFKDMHLMADTIKSLGMRPGLWMRPLCARHDEKESLLSPKIPGRDDPKNPTLDPTIPDNLERIRNYFKVYNQWGYQMVKHDFTSYDIFGRWGFNMQESLTSPGWSFHDNSKTNAEIILNLYKTIRKAATDNITIIGCNTVSHLSAGIFELQRTGDDTSGREWERTVKMGVNTLAFRLPQHDKFYNVDGDCVGITTKIPWSKMKQWLQLTSESSSALFISGQPEAMGAEQKAAVKQAFAKAAKPQPLAEPLDWMTNPRPEKWKLNGQEVMFDWH